MGSVYRIACLCFADNSVILDCMRTLSLSALLLPLAIIDGCASAVADELTVTVEPALAEIDPRPPGPGILRLPDMTFTLHITARCDADMQAESASVSISDTHLSQRPEPLADAATTELRIKVPQQQLAPLTIENFCFSEASASDSRDLNVADALTAQVSLHCAGENKQTIIYRATPLAVTLRCKIGDND